MINRILPFLNKIVPIGLAAKGLEKVNPKMKSFFSGALAAGYTADQAMDFLRQQFSGSQDQPSGSLRPDEEAGMNRRKFEEAPSRIAQGLGTVAAGALGGAGASALTGLGQAAMQNEQSSAQETQSQQPGGFLEFIKQNPELGSYLDSLIQKGMDPIQAASQAKKHRKFAPLVEKVERQMGQSFEDLLAQLFQGSKGPSDQRSQGGMSNQSAQGSDQSGGDSELIAALQQILKM